MVIYIFFIVDLDIILVCKIDEILSLYRFI